MLDSLEWTYYLFIFYIEIGLRDSETFILR